MTVRKTGRLVPSRPGRLRRVAMHPGQLHLTAEDAGALVAEQFPQWRGLPLRPVRSHGTVNLLYRLGDDLVLRFPLEPGDPDEKRAWLESEADAARRLLGRLPVRTPEPVGFGEPGPLFPLPWAVYRWLPGTIAGDDVAGSVGLARDVADVVTALRSLDTEGRSFSGSRRGGLLTSQDPYVGTYLDAAERLIDTDGLRRLWSRLRLTPRSPGECDSWTHGDLMPGNLLVRDGRLAAVIDVGGLAPADPALDLMPAWNLFDERARRTFREAVGVAEDEWDRGKGWAFAQAIGCLAYYRVTNPPMSATARRTLQSLLDDAVP